MRVKAKPHLRARSGPGEEFAILFRFPDGTDIDVLETHGEWNRVIPSGSVGQGVWVSNKYLVQDATPPADRLVRPTSLKVLDLLFGKPGNPECYAGIVKLPAPLKYSWQPGIAKDFQCHRLMVDTFTQVFQAIYEGGHWGKITYFGGCYNKRKKTANSEQWSTHSWGVSVDLDPLTNGYGNKRYTMHPAIIGIFEAHGFIAGARWPVPDAMHFQYVTGY